MKILCPTDYSMNAMSALETAIYYTKLLDAELHIVNIYGKEPEMVDSTIKLNQMLAGISAISEGYIVPIVEVIEGHASEEIIQYANRNEIDLIVMGTKGLNSIKNILFGSVTNNVASISNTPVLVVPQELAAEFNTHMLLAIDDQELTHEDAFKVPLEIAKSNDVKIDILHIQKKKETLPFDPFLFAFLKDRAGEVYLVPGSNVTQEIKNFTEKEKTGLLIMIRRPKSFFSRLLKVGNTEQEAFMTNTPLLILPDK